MADTSAPPGAVDPSNARVRTYHARRGRLSTTHRTALSRLSALWSLGTSGPVIDPAEVFGRAAALVVDLGCGMGESARAQASDDPETDIVALDVHTRGIATLLRGLEADGVTNVRVVLGDAVTFLDQRLAPQSLSGARIYFPDPWPKVRHAKRRLIQPTFVSLLSSRLVPGGFVHCATDDRNYAEQMREVFTAEPALQVHAALPASVRRPATKFERRARRLGHPIADIWVTRTLSP